MSRIDDNLMRNDFMKMILYQKKQNKFFMLSLICWLAIRWLLYFWI